METMVLVPQSEYETILKKLTTIEEMVKFKDVSDEWLESNQARKMFNISQRSWQRWRDEKLITFTQFGRKIWVKKSSIEEFMLNHQIKSNNGN